MTVAERILDALRSPFPIEGQDVVGRRRASASRRAAPARTAGRAAPQRRRRDVHGQGRRQEPRGGLRADDARGDRRPARAQRELSPAASAGASSSSSTSRSSRSRRARSPASRRSSAGAIPSRGLVGPAEFIPLAEETGADHRARPLGPRGGLPAGRRAGRLDAPAAEPLTRRRQPLGRQLQRADVRRRRARRSSRRRGLAPRAARPRDHRDRHVPRHVDDADRASPRSARPRRPHRDRRLRHRLLVARLPAPVPGRHPQDRPRVRRSGRTPRATGPSRPRSSRSAGRSTSTIVAEGIETAGPAASGCGRSAASSAQGYLFARPADADATLRFLKDGGSRRPIAAIGTVDGSADVDGDADERPFRVGQASA